MSPFIYGVFQKVRHVDIDWVILGALGLAGMISSVIAVLVGKHNANRSLGDDSEHVLSAEPDTKNSLLFLGMSGWLLAIVLALWLMLRPSPRPVAAVPCIPQESKEVTDLREIARKYKDQLGDPIDENIVEDSAYEADYHNVLTIYLYSQPKGATGHFILSPQDSTYKIYPDLKWHDKDSFSSRTSTWKPIPGLPEPKPDELPPMGGIRELFITKPQKYYEEIGYLKRNGDCKYPEIYRQRFTNGIMLGSFRLNICDSSKPQPGVVFVIVKTTSNSGTYFMEQTKWSLPVEASIH